MVESSISTLQLTVGGNETRVSFEHWSPSADVSDSSSIVVAVTSFDAIEAKGGAVGVAVNRAVAEGR